MKIKSFTKKALVVALLAGAAVGANAAVSSTTYNLGTVPVATPLPFSGTVIPAGFFSDIFNFTLPANNGSGYSVIAFDVANPMDGSYYFKTLLTTASLFSNPNGIISDGDDTLVATAAAAGNSLNISWGALAAGKYYLNVAGNTIGSIGGLYNGAISVTAVPEPESYAMFLAGLGIMGAIIRRRSRRQA